MERTLSPDERIRRAEEIYYRRKMQDTSRKSARVNVSDKKEYGLFKKMILQIAICIMIYAIFYMIQNTNYIFSEDVIKKANEILSYDINIKNIYEQGMQYINGFIKKDEVNNENSDENSEENQDENNGELENLQTENEVTQNTETQNEKSDEENKENANISENENIGGETVAQEESNENLSQMEQDAKYVIENKSLKIPLKGTITSRYGLRNPTNPKVPKNHTGIDIAVNEGTVFNAAMSGTVEEVSSER